jgi:sarcosine oxidase subunit gamma
MSAASFRSLLDPLHEAAGARWETIGPYRLVDSYGMEQPLEEQALKRLALMDLSPFPRIGLKGAGMASALRSGGLAISEQANRSLVQNDGSVLLRLSKNESLLLANPFGPPAEPDPGIDQYGPDCYSIRRRDSHYCFALSGSKCPEVLAKICAVDFRPESFANGFVAQTQVAKTTALVARHDLFQTALFLLLGDSSYISYMWRCLQDAMTEHDGQTLGLRAIRNMLNSAKT